MPPVIPAPQFENHCTTTSHTGRQTRGQDQQQEGFGKGKLYWDKEDDFKEGFYLTLLQQHETNDRSTNIRSTNIRLKNRLIWASSASPRPIPGYENITCSFSFLFFKSNTVGLMDPKERTQTLVVSSSEMRMDVNWMNMSSSIIKTNQPWYSKPLRTKYSTV